MPRMRTRFIGNSIAHSVAVGGLLVLQCFALLPPPCGCANAAAAANHSDAAEDHVQGVARCCCCPAGKPSRELPVDRGCRHHNRPDVECLCGCSERAPSCLGESEERANLRDELCEIAESVATGELKTVSASTLRITDCSSDHCGPSLRAMLCVWRI